MEEEIAVQGKRARLEEAPEAPAMKEGREVGKLCRVKVRLSDMVELRVWKGTKSNSGLQARAYSEPVQGVWRDQHLRAWAPAVPLQGVRRQ